jgi:glycosyltransferase involved in cell wall biosynthesis
MWNNKKISVILPAFNEEGNIAKAIEDFALPFVDEIIVVDNNSTDSTASEVLKTNKAILLQEKKQGYGFALRAGYSLASGDYLITAEPDGTFLGRDILKLLAYSEDCEVIFGTRTNKRLVWEGANMDFLLLAGNWLVAKLIEILFNTPTLSDVGCTMKFIKKEAFLKIKDKFKVGGSHFSAEFMLIVITSRLSFIEIPVNYKSRIGTSKITGSKIKTVYVALRMISLILEFRIRSFFKKI